MERLLFLSLMGHGKQQYLNLLKRRWKEILNLFRNRKIWFFQQDGAPCHRPKRIKTYIKRWLTSRILPHPSQSPDMNPIELIWAQMKRMVEKKRPNSRNELLRAIQSSWEEITLEDIRKCIENLPKKKWKKLLNVMVKYYNFFLNEIYTNSFKV